MPKLKTKSAVKKRVKLTGTGKVKAAQAFKRHLLINKGTKMKRNARGCEIVSKTVSNIIKKYIHW